MRSRISKFSNKQKEELKKFIKTSNSSGKEVRRAQSVLLLEDNVDMELIKQMTGYKKRWIYESRDKFLKEGIGAIKDKRKGKPKELLSKKQREELEEILENTTPENYGYNSDYWTTSILGNFIERKYEVKYKSKTSLYLIFRSAKFTYHKPGRVYEKHNDEEVLRWRKENKDTIKQALNDKDTAVLCEDEMILSTQTTFQKIWLPKGEYPKIEISNKRENRSVYGFLNIKTGEEHAYKTQKQNMFITKDVLEKITQIYTNKKLLILWDGAGWHRGSEVQNFIKKYNDQNLNHKINTIYFPRYTPEENPQEHVWKNGRSQVTHNKFIKNIDTATDEFITYLNNTTFNYSLPVISAGS